MPAEVLEEAVPAAERAPSPPLAEPDVEYPEWDGQPMADNTEQARTMTHVHEGLLDHFKSREVFVGCNLIVYLREGHPEECVVPDVFAVLGKNNRRRRGSYKVWEEGCPPDFVLEVASPRTWRIDEAYKSDLYASLGVQEYFQFDPEPEETLLAVRLRGRTLRGGTYEELPAARGAEGGTVIRSAVLGLDFWHEGPQLEVWDPDKEQFLSLGAARAAAEAAKAEAEAAKAEAEAAKAQAEAAKAQAEDSEAQAAAAKAQAAAAKAQAAAAKAQAAAAEARAEDEARARARMAARMARLEAALRESGREVD